jgi:phage/plasmid primase-like uncharacterized protein
VNTGALVNRMNFALNLAANKMAGIQTAWMANAGDGDLAGEVAVDQAPMDAAADELRLENRLIQDEVSDQTRKTLLAQVESRAEARTDNAITRSAPAQPINAAAQVTGKPKLPNPPITPAAREKQDALLAGLLLGSPEFQRR